MTDESFAKIDYSVRPAKYAERRMLSEIFRRVAPFDAPENYVYVGLGSVWFSDFVLFHRNHGVREMISIERATAAKSRVEANKPFRNIRMEFRTSSQVLPGLEWARRHFLWLDYDDQIDLDMLLDARTVASNATSGTVLSISVQCQKARQMNEAEQAGGEPSGLQRFITAFGRERVAPDTLEDDLSGWRFAAYSRNMFKAEIEAALADRNVLLAERDRLTFHYICDFEYADGAKMTTLTGVFVSSAEFAKHRMCAFSKLDFLPSRGKVVRIKLPLLTNREVRHLERQLPKTASEQWDLGAIPKAQAKLFATFYRYFPNFAVIEP